MMNLIALDYYDELNAETSGGDVYFRDEGKRWIRIISRFDNILNGGSITNGGDGSFTSVLMFWI